MSDLPNQLRRLGPAVDETAPDLEPIEDDTVLVVVAHDTPEGRVMPQPVYRRIPRDHAADWDKRWVRVR